MQEYVILQWQQQLFQVLQLFEKHCRDIQCTPLKKKEKNKISQHLLLLPDTVFEISFSVITCKEHRLITC